MRTIGGDHNRPPDRGLRVGLSHVKRLFVGRECHPVGAGHRVAGERKRAVGRQLVDAAEVELAARVVPALGQAVGRVGEGDHPRGVDGHVVGAVGPLALKGVGGRLLAAARLEPRDAAVAVLAADEPALPVECEAVGAPLAAVLGRPGEARGLQEDVEALARPPAVNAVVGDVGEEQAAGGQPALVARHPDRSLAPGEARGEHLDHGLRRHERVEAGIEPLDRAHGREQVAAGLGGGHVRRAEQDGGEAGEQEGGLTVGGAGHRAVSQSECALLQRMPYLVEGIVAAMQATVNHWPPSVGPRRRWRFPGTIGNQDGRNPQHKARGRRPAALKGLRGRVRLFGPGKTAS